jgi:RHS repeat-associated protein
VSETAVGVITTYLVDTLNPTGYSQVLDELVSGSVTKTYTYGLQRISENQLSGSTWTPTFYGYDGHGNVRFLTSSTGTVGNTYQYDAFGMTVANTGTTANSYLFSGERFDTGLNLYHLRARYYNQATGRFETMDPYQGKISNPGTLHKYVFTGNNPVNWVDPSGNDIEEYAELLHFTFEQIHTFHFAHGIGGCVQGTLALTNNALASLTGGETVEPDEEFPDCITRALWNPLQPVPYLPFPPYPPDWPYWPYQ